MEEISNDLCNKSELIEDLSKKFELPFETMNVAFDAIFEKIASSLQEECRVEIRGLGSFEIRYYKGYKGHNPQNKKTIEIPDKRLPVFKTGIFKNDLNEK